MAPVTRVVNIITGLVVAVIFVGVLLVLFEANEDNAIVAAILDVVGFLAAPFEDFFEIDEENEQLAVNWGIAAAVYGVFGLLLSRALAAAGRATAATAERRRERRTAKLATLEERGLDDDGNATAGDEAPQGRRRRMPWRRRT